jgi:hypothetical protein
MLQAQVGKELLDNELAARHQAFDSGKPVKGCRGERAMHIRLLGLRLTNLKDELAGSRKGSIDAVRVAIASFLGWETERRGDVMQWAVKKPQGNSAVASELAGPVVDGYIREPHDSGDDREWGEEGLSDGFGDRRRRGAGEPDDDSRDEPPKRAKTVRADDEDDFACPVCGCRKRWNLQALNEHLDICLNRMSRRPLMCTSRSGVAEHEFVGNVIKSGGANTNGPKNVFQSMMGAAAKEAKRERDRLRRRREG